jgi:hypothetical protein
MFGLPDGVTACLFDTDAELLDQDGQPGQGVR